MKKILIILALSFLLSTCWMPPYDENIANTLYMTRNMEYIGQMNLDDIDFYHGASEWEFYWGRIQLAPLLPDLYNDAYIQHLDTKGSLRFFYIENNKKDLSFQLGTELYYNSFTGPDFSTYFLAYDNVQYPSAFAAGSGYGISLFTDITGGGDEPPARRFIHFDHSILPPNWIADSIAPTTFDDGNSSNYLLSSYATFNKASGLNEYITIEYTSANLVGPTVATKVYRYPISDTMTASVTPVVDFLENLYSVTSNPGFNVFEESRMAFHPASNILVISDLYDGADVNYSYWVDISAGGYITKEQFERVPHLQDAVVLADLEDGSFLFQSRDTLQNIRYTLWHPDGRYKSLFGGSLFFANHLYYQGEHYLVFNHYLQEDKGSNKYLRLYIIEDGDFRDLFRW